MKHSLARFCRKSLFLCFLSLFSLVNIVPSTTSASPQNIGEIDLLIDQARKDWKVPGLAVGIVKEGQVIFSKGYGFRDLERKLPVTEKTLFAIGSISKSFTASAMAMLVNDQHLDWDRPVREYLPELRLYDEYATSHITSRDLVTHRSGLPRHDFVWYSSGFSREDLVSRLRYLEPSQELRSGFQYNNLMFMLAGYVAGKIAGTTWEDLVRRRIFIPLGMENSNFSVIDSQKNSDFSLPYMEAKDRVVKQIPFHNLDAVGPAGSINSNVEDMSRYLMFHISNAEIPTLLEMQRPQIHIPSVRPFPEMGEGSYGLGFFVSSYRGHKLIEHAGGIDGFTAHLGFLPEEKTGVIVLANSHNSLLPQIAFYTALDRLLNLDQIPWNQRYLDLVQKTKENQKANEKRDEPKPDTRLSHNRLEDYVGTFQHPGYGILKIGLGQSEDGSKKLSVTLNQLETSIRHFHYDVFETVEDPVNLLVPPRQKMLFISDIKGDLSSISISLETSVKDIVFKQVSGHFK